jgi:hypothetical protein
VSQKVSTSQTGIKKESKVKGQTGKQASHQASGKPSGHAENIKISKNSKISKN